MTYFWRGYLAAIVRKNAADIAPHNLSGMLSQNKQKQIRQLAVKKHRDEQQRFVAEGSKIIADLIGGGLTPLFVAAETATLDALPLADSRLAVPCTAADIKAVSLLTTPPDAVAVFPKPAADTQLRRPDDLALLLDRIQDPGNMGTIIRVADWFGIRRIFCSDTCADAFAPKVVQATMGAIARVRVTETDLGRLLDLNRREWHLPVAGTFLEGENIYTASLPKAALVVMGNEGRGISPDIARLIDNKLLIPAYPPNAEGGSESLNVATATAVVCSEFRRRLIQ